MYVSDLIGLIPKDSRQRVEATRTKWGPSIREAIKAESRFLLKWNKKSRGDELHRPDGQITISTSEIGKPLPPEIIRYPIPPEYELAARLQIWLPKICTAIVGTTDMLELVSSLGPALTESGVNIDEAHASYQSGKVFAELLERLAQQDKFDLVRYILRASPHVLGVFQYQPRDDSYGPNDRYSNPGVHRSTCRTSIKLYWGAIAISATARNISIEGLTAKVLAHELGHTYSYLGYDRDGTRWSGEEFAQLDLDLKEGLAQYYAYRIGLNIQSKFPELLEAYYELLPRQRDEYRAHLPWIENDSPEALGSALAKARRQGVISIDHFADCLSAEKRY